MSNCAKKLDVEITRIEFKAKPIGNWTNDELRREIKRRLDNKFLGHSFSSPHLESECGNEATGHSDIEPAIPIPADAKSDLHPGTIEWAIAKMKEGQRVRRNWWHPEAYAFLASDPEAVIDQEYKYSDALEKSLSVSTDQPVPIFVDKSRRAHLLTGNELISRFILNNWELAE